MDFVFFKNLTKKEAKAFLDNFLKESGMGFETLIPSLMNENLIVDYSVDSITSVLEWISLKLNVVQTEKDETLPEWIAQSSIYKENLFSFDNLSDILILRGAFYFGESFVRSYKKLSWNIGHSKTMEHNMPVVTGFMKKIELAPILICENLMRRIKTGVDISTISKAVSSWQSYLV